MNSYDAWQRATTKKPQPVSAGKMFGLCFLLFAVVAFWPVMDFDAMKHFMAAAIVCGIPGGLILLACRASHGKGQARNALGGVAILVVVLILFALLF